MKTIAYRRVSTRDQGQHGHSLEEQGERLTAALGEDLVAIFTDVVSGGAGLDKRVGLAEAIAVAKELDAAVVVTDYTRLSRNLRLVVELLEDSGVTFKDLEGRIDTSTPSAWGMTMVQFTFAEMQRREAGHKTRRTMAKLKADGDLRHPGLRQAKERVERFEPYRAMVEATAALSLRKAALTLCRETDRSWHPEQVRRARACLLTTRDPDTILTS